MRVTSDVGPFSITPEWVLDAEISDRAVRLYGLLGRYADQSGASFASRKKLAERLRCSVPSVDRAVLELAAIGALEKEVRNRENGSQTSNLYRLRMSSPVIGGVITSDEGGVITPDAPIRENHLERETPLAAAPRVSRKDPMWDPLWDVLTEGFGPATTKDAQGRRAKAVKALLEAGATPDEVLARGKRWRRHFPGATMTQEALVKWWDTLPRKELR